MQMGTELDGLCSVSGGIFEFFYETMSEMLMSTIDTTFRMEQRCEWSLDYYVETRASLTSRDGYLQYEDTQWHHTCNNQWHTGSNTVLCTGLSCNRVVL